MVRVLKYRYDIELDGDSGPALVHGTSAFWQGSHEFSPRFEIFSLLSKGMVHLFITSTTNGHPEAFFEPNFPASTLCPIPTILPFRTSGMTQRLGPLWGTYRRKELLSSCPYNKSCCICDL